MMGLKAEPGVPKGYQRVEAYLNPLESVCVVLGDPDEDPGHNCDAMGCSSVSHVLYRLPLISATRLRQKDDALSEALRFLQDFKNLAGTLQALTVLTLIRTLKRAIK